MNGNTLYKYRSLYKEDGSLNKFTWKLLFNGEIYLSDFESLNDPCEGQIIPRYRDITKEKILKIHPWMDTMPYFNDIDWKSEEVVTRIQDILTPSIKEKLKKYGVFVYHLIVKTICYGLIMRILIKVFVLDLI